MKEIYPGFKLSVPVIFRSRDLIPIFAQIRDPGIL
jgi:hypothetical protein